MVSLDTRKHSLSLQITNNTANRIPTRPPPLARNEVHSQGQGQGQGQDQNQNQSAGHQSTQVPPGYAQIPLPPQPGFNGDWRHINSGAPSSALTNFSADSGIMVLAPSNDPQEAMKERTRERMKTAARWKLRCPSGFYTGREGRVWPAPSPIFFGLMTAI